MCSSVKYDIGFGALIQRAEKRFGGSHKPRRVSLATKHTPEIKFGDTAAVN